MEEKNPIKLIGLQSIKEIFFVFLLFGFVLILGGGVCLDLTKNLPSQYLKIIEESLSINTFGLLSIVSLCILAVWRLIKGEEALKHPFVTKIILPLSRAGLSAGAITAGMLLGIGLGLWLITLGGKHSELALNAIQFIGLSAFLALFIIPLIVLHLYLLFPCKQKVLWLDLVSAIYTVLVMSMFFVVDNYLDWKSVGVLFVIFVIFAFLIKKNSA
ncbi:hypothetical protein KFV02_08210 [Desulfohalobiaceae bacterium Ax17]|uniref:hypothetical protein n=1 Tax=Desulfovulcanus ferrireducens TaxID=2831190 RepID=UPI00207BB7BE|nr:hypothetical protein [Desulfovulcanus ferrireducens]MBT8763914.1 hypothetical protein [Desulfovulcanus ferrireducens]